MKKIKLVICAAVVIALSSCRDSQVRSLQPFYTDETMVVKRGIEGDWLIASNDTTDILRIEMFTYRRDSVTLVSGYKITPLKIRKIYANRIKFGCNLFKNAKGDYYCCVSSKKRADSGKPDKGELPILAHLIKIGNRSYYLDLTRFSDADNLEYSIGIHNIAKLLIQKNYMFMSLASTEFFNKSLKEKLVKIPFQQIEEISSGGGYQTKAVLTAKPKQLQRFVVKYDSQLFDSSALAFPLRRIIYR